MVRDTCTTCLRNTQIAPVEAREPNPFWVCRSCSALSPEAQEQARLTNARRKNCHACSRPFAMERMPSCSLYLYGWWYCSAECHPHSQDDEEKLRTRPGTPGSLRYYIAYSGLRDHYTEAELEALDGPLQGVDNDYDYHNIAD
jgi:hypothetical protein